MQNNKIKTVITGDETPQPIEILESSIVELAKGMKILTKSRLQQETIVTLLAWKSGVGRVEVRNILGCLEDLENLFLKKIIK